VCGILSNPLHTLKLPLLPPPPPKPQFKNRRQIREQAWFDLKALWMKPIQNVLLFLKVINLRCVGAPIVLPLLTPHRSSYARSTQRNQICSQLGILSSIGTSNITLTIDSRSKDASVRIWDLPKPPLGLTEFASAPTSDPIIVDWIANKDSADLTSVSWDPAGDLLAIGSFDSILRIAYASGQQYFTNTQHRGPIFATKFSENGQWLLTASLDGTTCLWSVNDRSLHKQYQCHSDCCLDVDWLDDNTFATCGADNNIHILRVDDGSLVKTFSLVSSSIELNLLSSIFFFCRGHSNEVNLIKRSPTGTHLASCSDDTTARVWDLKGILGDDAIPGLNASTSVVLLEGHTHAVSTVQWCPNPSIGPHPLVATYVTLNYVNTSTLY
jgi:WD40 repeat protein